MTIGSELKRIIESGLTLITMQKVSRNEPTFMALCCSRRSTSFPFVQPVCLSASQKVNLSKIMMMNGGLTYQHL